MNKKEYKKLQKQNKLVNISSEIFGDNALAIESILNALIINNKESKAVITSTVKRAISIE